MDTIDTGELTAGTLIGGAYRVIRPVAEGGMGVIYEVEQEATGARRALKVMHGQFAADSRLRKRFVREARLAASIPSDHVAMVLDAGQDEGSGALFIVMELLDGVTLGQELRRSGAFPWKDALAVLGQIAHALGAAHAVNIVHRDLKPANVFLARSRNAVLPFTVKLLDFGIAKAIAGDVDATVAVMGTPIWMAPEQTTVDAPVGPPADVWSFGLLTFYVLAGRHYFTSGNTKSAATATVLREVILEPLVPASERAADFAVLDRLPQGFDVWFARCVDRLPENRYRDASEAFAALSVLGAPLQGAGSARWRAWSPGPETASEAAVTSVETPNTARRVVRVAPTPAPSTVTASRRTLARPSWTAPSLVSFGLLLGLALAAVVASHERNRAPSGATVDAEPVGIAIRIHGSNTIGSELAPALAEAFLQKQTGGKTVVRKRRSPDEMVVEAVDDGRVVEQIEVFAHGTSTAFEDLVADRCDIGMASRRIRPEEVSTLSRLGDLSSAATERVIALDGIAVIVNPENPVSALTTRQIANIFSGNTHKWSEVGGRDQPIAIHARDDKSGTYDTFRHVVLGALSLAPGAKRHESSEELSDAVASDPQAVGFIGLPYVRSAKAVMVQDAEASPLLPSPMTVSTEEYSLARRLYLYVPLKANPLAHELVDFALSEDGQKIVQASGFVDLRPECDPSPARCSSCPREYREIVRDACRMSMDFRFDQDSTRLDTRGLADLQRVVTLLEKPSFSGRSVLLLGFSDGAASQAESLATSKEHADVVASQLSARGLHVEVQRGLGAIAPIADDATEEGREKNRRVEVWLR